MDNNNDLQQRIDHSISNNNMINPDEQRKYLGTFRERIITAINVADLQSKKYIDKFEDILKSNNTGQIILNGNLSHSFLSPYIRLATKYNVKFIIKTDKLFGIRDNNYGLVYASNTAINQNDIDIENQ